MRDLLKLGCTTRGKLLDKDSSSLQFSAKEPKTKKVNSFDSVFSLIKGRIFRSYHILHKPFKSTSPAYDMNHGFDGILGGK